MNGKITLLTAALSMVLWVAPASAEEPGGAKAPRVMVGAKVGLMLPQVATELSAAPGGELEAGYQFGRLGLWLALGYAQPEVTRSGVEDPRLPASYDGTQTQRELSLGAGLSYRLRGPGGSFNAYAALGPRLYFLETKSVGNAGAAEFGENREQSTRIGAVLALGSELRLGPGSVVGELQLGSSSLPHLITGEVTTTAVVFYVGYRLFL